MLATENKSNLLKLLHKSPCYAITLDEFCDIINAEQMSIFVRFLKMKIKY